MASSVAGCECHDNVARCEASSVAWQCSLVDSMISGNIDDIFQCGAGINNHLQDYDNPEL